VTRRLAAAVSALTMLAAGCTVRHHASSTPAGPPTGTPAPHAAAPSIRVVLPTLEAFVEKERGLRFKHPVKVSLLSRKAFVAKLRSLQKPPSAADAEKSKATLAALGLISPSLDLVKAFRTAYDAGTLGFYSFSTKRLYVRGTKATPGVQAVLTHELTHALTDQWFGLKRPALAKDNQEKSMGFTALTEGDAERTRMAFEAKLSAADKKAAEREEGSGGSPKVPQIVLELIGFPYAIGPSFVDAVLVAGGIARLNQAYRKPPVSSEQLLNPQAYLHHDDPVTVATPHADGTVVDHSDLGQVGLLLTLATRLDPQTARGATEGWGGDQYVVWRAGHNRWCLRDTVVMDDSGGTTEIGAALTQWAQGSHGRAHIEQEGQRTTFVSCSS
jgi:hypothetical protein